MLGCPLNFEYEPVSLLTDQQSNKCLSWLLLNWTQVRKVAVVFNPEAWVNRLSEFGVEGVEVTQSVR